MVQDSGTDIFQILTVLPTVDVCVCIYFNCGRKTSSIRVAAERAGAGYCRLVVGFGVLGTLEGWLAKAEEQLQDVDSDKNIMAAFTKECKRAMTSLLSKLTAEITQRVSEKEV